jgi:hypothetical protein
MPLRLVASLWVATLLSATAAFAELRGVRVSPSFTLEEIGLIGRDARLAGAAKRCAWQIRQALDALAAKSDETTSRVGVAGPDPCPPVPHGPSGSGRASDEGALDILKILKDVSEQGTGRSGEGQGAGANSKAPLFTADELVLIHKDKAGRLTYAARHCAWQLRRAFDTLRHGTRNWPPQRLCSMSRGDTSSRSAEGALDILKILREASGDSN